MQYLHPDTFVRFDEGFLFDEVAVSAAIESENPLYNCFCLYSEREIAQDIFSVLNYLSENKKEINSQNIHDAISFITCGKCLDLYESDLNFEGPFVSIENIIKTPDFICYMARDAFDARDNFTYNYNILRSICDNAADFRLYESLAVPVAEQHKRNGGR